MIYQKIPLCSCSQGRGWLVPHELIPVMMAEEHAADTHGKVLAQVGLSSGFTSLCFITVDSYARGYLHAECVLMIFPSWKWGRGQIVLLQHLRCIFYCSILAHANTNAILHQNLQEQEKLSDPFAWCWKCEGKFSQRM